MSVTWIALLASSTVPGNLDDLPEKLLGGRLVIELIKCTRDIHEHILAVGRRNDFSDSNPLGILFCLFFWWPFRIWVVLCNEH